MLTSLLSTDKDKGSYKTPLFYTFKLFSNNCYGNSIDTYVQCDTFNTEKYKGIPYLDVSAVYNKETKTVFINVVNRHKEKSIVTEIRSISGIFTGKVEANVLNSESLDAPFTFDKQELYKPLIKEIKVEGNKFSYSFPPHSFTQIKVGIK